MIGISSTFAPRVSNILLTLEFWSAKPNWIPRKPKLMFQICQNVRVGFCFVMFREYQPKVVKSRQAANCGLLALIIL
jgi:hypothetical protein